MILGLGSPRPRVEHQRVVHVDVAFGHPDVGVPEDSLHDRQRDPSVITVAVAACRIG
jgi:hypothetical protein